MSFNSCFGTYLEDDVTRPLTQKDILKAIALLEDYKRPKNYFNEIRCSIDGYKLFFKTLTEQGIVVIEKNNGVGLLGTLQEGHILISHSFYIPDSIGLLIDNQEDKMVGFIDFDTLELHFINSEEQTAWQGNYKGFMY